MPLPPSRNPRAGARPPGRHARVLSIGQRVFVHCPGGPREGVGLTDQGGRSTSQWLVDGSEVEVVAWQPRGAGGTRYRVRSIPERSEGWLAAQELRPGRQPEPPETPPTSSGPAPPSAPGVDEGRKFGQRR